MKFLKKYWFLLALVVLGLILFFVARNGYNQAVVLEESLTEKWGNVESQYQRRMDLIPNLVKIVKEAAGHEKEVLIGVTNARSKASNITVDPTKLTPEMIQNFQGAQGELSQALGRLMVTVERYPEIKANQNFRDLSVQLEGTENRINVARTRYNAAVKEYNTHIRSFPNNIVLNWFGDFEKKAPFKADPASSVAPEVDFE